MPTEIVLKDGYKKRKETPNGFTTACLLNGTLDMQYIDLPANMSDTG